MIRTALVLIAVFFCGMSIASELIEAKQRPLEIEDELFAPELARVTSVDEAERWISRRLPSDASQADAAEGIARFMRLRFAHDLAEFRFTQDWLAYLAGYVWRDLRAPVRADDLLQNRRAICSQQTIVFQALLERFGIDYATISFANPLHMLVGAKIGGVWAVYDSDKEPKRDRIVTFEEVRQGDALVEMYAGKPGIASFGFGNDVGLQWQKAAAEGMMELGGINTHPAPQAVLFHTVTGFLSGWGWLIFSGLAGLSLMSARMPPLVRPSSGAKAPGRARSA